MDTRRSSTCQGKRRHKSKGAAEAAMRSILRVEPGSAYEVYPCPFCREWRVGHKTNGNPKNKYAAVAR